MRLFNKQRILVLICTCVLLILTGCKNTEKQTSEASSDTVSSTPTITVTEEVSDAAKSEEEKMQTINTIMGDVKIPVNPQRIAAFGNAGDLVAMGVIPIAGDSEARLFDGLLTNENYTFVENGDLEGIMALNPELIILSYIPEQDTYDKLSAIAPTVVTDALNLSMPERIALTGKLVGKEAEAEKALFDYETQAEEYKSQLFQSGIENKTVTVMEGYYLFGNKYGRGADIVYDYLGFTAPEKLQETFNNGEKYMEVSLEVLSEYCGDYIINSVWDGSEDLSENAVWNSIPAVKNGHVIEIDFSDYFSRDLYTSGKQMKLLAEAFLALD